MRKTFLLQAVVDIAYSLPDVPTISAMVMLLFYLARMDVSA
jgi:hypothetical protein